MSFQPVVPIGGMAGWAFLRRTAATQMEAFKNSPTLQRETDYFSKHIGEVRTVDDLMADRQLLKVALGAFGLQDDLPNKAYIRKVLSEGSTNPKSFANRLVDKRYLAFTKAFGFDLKPPNTVLSGFASKIVSAYQERQFEVAVGEQDSSMRLALSLTRELGEIAAKQNTDDGRWFAVMGNTALREVFQTAFGLPSATSSLDIDEQLKIFRDRAKSIMGNSEISQFADSQAIERITHLFLTRTQIREISPAISSSQTALTLLQSIPRGARKL